MQLERVARALRSLGDQPLTHSRADSLAKRFGVDRARLLRVPWPSRPTIDRRLERSPGLKVHRRCVATPGSADPRISPGSFVVERALDVVQIDHTPMDIVVVDDLYRRPLGKPYLTLAWVAADAEALSRAYKNGSTELLTDSSLSQTDRG